MLFYRHKEASAVLKHVMHVLRAKQKEVEAIEAQLAKMMDELRVRNLLTKLTLIYKHRQRPPCVPNSHI